MNNTAAGSVDDNIEDAIFIAEYLLSRFKQEKLFIMGLSHGADWAFLAAQRRPSLFYACIGVAPYWDIAQNVGYQWKFLEQRVPSPLLAYGTLQPTHGYMYAFYFLQLLTIYGAACRRCYFSYPCMPWPDVPNPPDMLLSTFYGWNAVKIPFRIRHVYENVIASMWEGAMSNFSFDIPVYVLQGEFDKMANVEVMHSYFDKINAPHKHLLMYENSSHFLATEQPERFVTDLIKVKQQFANRCAR